MSLSSTSANSVPQPGSTEQADLRPEFSSPMRWIVIAMVFLATLINYLDRQTLSIIIPVLTEQFHMTNTAYSRVVFAFMLAYTISNGFAGWIIDRLGTKAGYGLFMLWWSIASVLQAFATGVLSLGLFRFLLGIGEAGNWPGGVKVVAEWFPVRDRALASGIFNSGASIGAVAAPPMIAWLFLHYGWRATFVAVGASGFAWLIVWFFLYYTPGLTRSGPAVRVRVQSVHLLKSPWIWCFILSKMLMDPVWYFYVFWFPQYLKQARGFDIAAIGKLAWIPFLTAGLGNVLGGWLAAFLLNRGAAPSTARKITYAIFACLMTTAIPAVLVSDAMTSILLVSVATMGYTGALANQLAMPADVFPQEVVASVWGFGSMGAGFGGMLFSVITGWAIDHYSYTPVFIGYGILPLLSALVTAYLLGPLRLRHLKAS